MLCSVIRISGGSLRIPGTPATGTCGVVGIWVLWREEEDEDEKEGQLKGEKNTNVQLACNVLPLGA